MKNHKFVRKIYRDSEIKRIREKINTLNSFPLDEVNFLNIRFITSITLFFITLLIFKAGYILSPTIAIIYYYLFEYIFLLTPTSAFEIVGIRINRIPINTKINKYFTFVILSPPYL